MRHFPVGAPVLGRNTFFLSLEHGQHFSGSAAQFTSLSNRGLYRTAVVMRPSALIFEARPLLPSSENKTDFQRDRAGLGRDTDGFHDLSRRAGHGRDGTGRDGRGGIPPGTYSFLYS